MHVSSTILINLNLYRDYTQEVHDTRMPKSKLK